MHDAACRHVSLHHLTEKFVYEKQHSHELSKMIQTKSCINLVKRVNARQIHVEKTMESLNLKMPAPAVPKGNFVNYVLLNENTVFLSGHLPQPAVGAMVPGKVGKDLTTEEAYEVAKLCGLNLCATLKHNLGDLDRVKRIVKLTGFVNCIDGYSQQPAVINGCSDLMVQVFGPVKGAHARSAVGTNALPLGVPVEIEAIVEIEK